jgi:hypothetical protein
MIADAALLSGGRTAYARAGDLFGYACAVLALLVWWAPRPRRKT